MCRHHQKGRRFPLYQHTFVISVMCTFSSVSTVRNSMMSSTICCKRLLQSHCATLQVCKFDGSLSYWKTHTDKVIHESHWYSLKCNCFSCFRAEWLRPGSIRRWTHLPCTRWSNQWKNCYGGLSNIQSNRIEAAMIRYFFVFLTGVLCWLREHGIRHPWCAIRMGYNVQCYSIPSGFVQAGQRSCYVSRFRKSSRARLHLQQLLEQTVQNPRFVSITCI